ncbi:MAG TPA: pyridoxamine 5'-phosphate oxidase family protein [Longimicrobium sp.]|nr:pyridoxamine 5'-phosphate oxidase family protein [Longimicrobium sp.]
MDTLIRPTFREMSREECEDLLARHHVGRLAYARGRDLEIEPLHYVYHDGWLYGRTSPGTKLETTGPDWWPVAFEVDEIEAMFRWKSVVLHGGFYPLDREGAAWEQREWSRGVDLLRQLIPGTFTDEDPVPHRTVLFRISVQEVAGRQALPWPEEGGTE